MMRVLYANEDTDGDNRFTTWQWYYYYMATRKKARGEKSVCSSSLSHASFPALHPHHHRHHHFLLALQIAKLSSFSKLN